MLTARPVSLDRLSERLERGSFTSSDYGDFVIVFGVDKDGVRFTAVQGVLTGVCVYLSQGLALTRGLPRKPSGLGLNPI